LLSSIDKLKNQELQSIIIPWASPVFVFGDFVNSKIATVGINPSNKEFIDNFGNELNELNRRFCTLKSLGLKTWDEIGDKDLNKLLLSYRNYFFNNPYDAWFKKLDKLLANSNLSYYSSTFPMCHIDLIPFATKMKWGKLNAIEKNKLISNSEEIVKSFISKTDFKYFILNGRTVLELFKEYFDLKYEINEVKDWEIKRKTSPVKGYSFEASFFLKENSNIIKVLGFNHNVQSSYGISKDILMSIKKWITNKIE